jgi:hypothetical protein
VRALLVQPWRADPFHSLVARIGFEISHGYTVQGRHDPMLLVAEQANSDFAKGMAPGAYLCDVFPICMNLSGFARARETNTFTVRYIPEWTGARFKKEAKECRKTMEALRDGPYNDLKKQVVRNLVPCLGTTENRFDFRHWAQQNPPSPPISSNVRSMRLRRRRCCTSGHLFRFTPVRLSISLRSSYL